ncbi:MAG: DNA polymerase III subunit [Blastocatellia bacterium]
MFPRLFGNSSAKQLLTRFITAGRVPNAMLFAGTEGVGKKLFAIELARAFICQSPNGVEGCGECPACKRAGIFELPKSDKGEDYDRVFVSEHPDVGIVVPFKRNLRVGAIRDLEKEAYYRPFEANARFFVVDDADKMTDAASNALLKTLEEPAATSHIILISSRPDTLLPTIRSRAQIVRFSPVAANDIEAFLIDRGVHSREDARLAARLAEGSIGRASLIDLAKFRGQRQLMLRVLVNAIAEPVRAALLRTGEQMNDAKNKDDYEDTLALLEGLIRDVWLLKNGAGEPQIQNADILAELSRFAENASAPKLASWLNEIETLRENFAVNINRKIATDALFMKMSA